MTPEDRAKLNELYEWMQQKKVQQISYPLDLASKATMGVPAFVGPGASALTQEYTDSNTDTHDGPKAYADTIIIEIDGTQYEIPYL